MKKWIYVMIALLFVACNDNDNGGDTSLELRLTDAPADYEQVLIEILDVNVNLNDEWIELDEVNEGIYDLLNYTNGVDTLLANGEFPAGTISQIRLILGEENSVVIDGQSYDLETPSAQQSGLKINIQSEFESGVSYQMWLDFDAGKSIVEKGNGGYSLKPVIRAYTDAISGSIKGSVCTSIESQVYIDVVGSDGTEYGTYSDAESGFYQLSGIPEGTYQITMTPKDSYSPKSLSDVSVANGEVTELEEVCFDEVVPN